MCYTNKNKYNKKINSLDTKNREKLDYKKLRLGDDYQYPSEEEQEKKQEEKQEEETISDVNKFYEPVNKPETGMNTELFKKHFKIQRPSDMLKYQYQTNDRKKNHELVNMIYSGIEDLIRQLLYSLYRSKNMTKQVYNNLIKPL